MEGYYAVAIKNHVFMLIIQIVGEQQDIKK